MSMGFPSLRARAACILVSKSTATMDELMTAMERTEEIAALEAKIVFADSKYGRQTASQSSTDQKTSGADGDVSMAPVSADSTSLMELTDQPMPNPDQDPQYQDKDIEINELPLDYTRPAEKSASELQVERDADDIVADFEEDDADSDAYLDEDFDIESKAISSLEQQIQTFKSGFVTS